MRYVLLDRVVSVERGKSLRALKIFPLSDELFRSSLSFLPVVTESLLIETMAQAGGVLLSFDDMEEPSGLVFAKIEKAKFSSRAYVGEQLTVTAEVLEPSPVAARIASSLSCEGREIASMSYFLARRSLGEEQGHVDEEAFLRSHRERGAVLGMRSFTGGE